MRLEDFSFDGPDTEETREKMIKWAEDFIVEREVQKAEPVEANHVPVAKGRTLRQARQGQAQ
jgi:hypothetical protein